MREFPTPPDGYEIVDRSVEPGNTLVDLGTWRICYPERPGCAWRKPGTCTGVWSLNEFPDDAILARPIRTERWAPTVLDEGPSNRALRDVGVQMDSLAAEEIARETDRRILAGVPASPWVPTVVSQPPVGVPVHWRRVGSDARDLGPAQARIPITNWDDDIEWLDLDAVDRLAAENDRLREELVNEREISGARIAELEKELDRCRESDGESVRLRSELSRARDTEIGLLRTVAQLRREKERGPVELTFGELVRMAVRDQSFDPEA